MGDYSKIKGYKKLSTAWQNVFKTTLERHQQNNSQVGAPLAVRLMKDNGCTVIRVEFEDNWYKYTAGGNWY